MASANSSFDAVASTTLKNYRGKFADNVSTHIPFWKFMKLKGMEKISGGDTILEELMYAEGNGDFYDPATDKMNTAKPEGLSAAEFNWKYLYSTVVIDGAEEVRNSGPEKQQSILEARTKQAEITMQNKAGAAIFGDGTGSGGKAILGLQAIVDIAPTTGILGGINRANSTFWRNKVNASVGSYATGGLEAVETMIRDCTRGTDMPTLIVSGSTIFGYALARANGRAQFNNPELAGLGFKALKIDGIDYIFDSQCPADRKYVLNHNYLKIRIHKDRNFVTGKFIEPADEDKIVAKVRTAMQLTVSNCALQGVLGGFLV